MEQEAEPWEVQTADEETLLPAELQPWDRSPVTWGISIPFVFKTPARKGTAALTSC